MICSLRTLAGILVVGGLVGTPWVALAQRPPAGEIAGGYSYLAGFTDNLNIPAGWFVSGGVNITDILAVVGEVGGAHKTQEAFGSRADVDVYTFMGGVRYYRRLARMTPFAQFLLGGGRLRSIVDHPPVFPQNPFLTDSDETQTKFAIQPGAGIDIHLTDRLAARAQGDWRRFFSGDTFGPFMANIGDNDEFRFAVGIVVGLGSRY